MVSFQFQKKNWSKLIEIDLLGPKDTYETWETYKKTGLPPLRHEIHEVEEEEKDSEEESSYFGGHFNYLRGLFSDFNKRRKY